MGASKSWYEVICPKDIHGFSNPKGNASGLRRVRVPKPRTRKEKNHGGCPECLKDTPDGK